MKRVHLIIGLCLIPFLFQACIPTTVVTHTAYNPNRYRLGHTLGRGKVHITGAVGSATIARSEAPVNASTFIQSGGIETTLNSSDGTYFCELTVGVAGRTDLSVGLGGGAGSTIWNVTVQQQLTRLDQPFALSVAPGYTQVSGGRDQVETARIQSSMNVVELKVPMSYRLTRKVELLWGAGLLGFNQRAEYENQSLNTSRKQHWSSFLLTAGFRLGFLTVEAANLSWGGARVTTVGVAARLGG